MPGTARKLKRVDEFIVRCDGVIVKRVFTVKYLGVILDETLSGSAHAMVVLKTAVAKLAFLYRNLALLDFYTRKNLCNALIQPHIDYCASSWYSGLSAQLKSKLHVLQRKMVRFIYGFDYRHSVGKIDLRGLSWLSIPDRVSYFKLVLIFKIRTGTAPAYLMPNFNSVSGVHSHFTRSSNHNFHVSKSLSISPSTFCLTSVKDWNGLPSDLKEIASLTLFRKKLKQYLLSRYH